VRWSATRLAMALFHIIVVPLVLLSVPCAAAAQQSARLGMLLTGSPTRPTPAVDAFFQRLAELGWVEGRTIAVERRWTEDPGQLSALAVELAGLKPHVIVTPGQQATAAAKAATTSIPTVMIASSDPVAAGFVSSLARPGGNLTGVTVAHPELMSGKRLEILIQALPGLQQVAMIWDTSVNPLRQESSGSADAEARRIGVRLHHLTVRSVAEVDDAFRAARMHGARAALIMETPLFSANATLIADRGLQHRLPVMALLPPLVERGALLSYGPNLTDLFLRAATYVDRILRGTSPAALPIEQPSTFALVINLKTAKVLGLTVPPSLLSRADRVIE
jgi:putative ABC transport system substrate-binding protein